MVATPPRREPPFWPQLVELYGFLTTQRRRHLFVLLALMLAGAIAELATIGSLFPFLSLLAGVEQPARAPSLARIFAAAGATTPRQQVWMATALFAAIALIAGAIRVALSWSTQMFSARLGHELSVDVQRRILAQPYAYHLTHNSSEAVAAMDRVQSLVIHVLLQLIYASAAAFIALVIIAALIYVQPFTAIIAATAFSLIYVVVCRHPITTPEQFGIDRHDLRRADYNRPGKHWRNSRRDHRRRSANLPSCIRQSEPEVQHCRCDHLLHGRGAAVRR